MGQTFMGAEGHPPTVGIVLAGGQGLRMGGADKALLTLGGRTLLDRVCARLAPQCRSLIVSANGDPARFAGLTWPVVPDDPPDQAGPLAGILSGLDWIAANVPSIEWLVSCPGDTPFLPDDLVRGLHEARKQSGSSLACAASGTRVHHAVGLWPVRLRHDLRRSLSTEGERSVRHWTQRHGTSHAVWPQKPRDPFFNINTAADLAEAEDLVTDSPNVPSASCETAPSSTVLDLSGLKCPLPVLRTRKALSRLPAGSILSVACTDPLAAIDVPNLIRETGDELIEQRHAGGASTFVIRKARANEKGPA